MESFDYIKEPLIKGLDKQISVSPAVVSFNNNEDKMVQHPDHYQSSSGLEVIEAIKAFTEDLTGMQAVCTANALKYLCRWHKKNGIQDLKKAKWYIDYLINEETNGDN